MGLPGYGAVLMSRVPSPPTPPGSLPLAHFLRSARRRLRAIQRSRHPVCHRFRGRIPHGPRACVPTLLRSRCRSRRKARYWLGRATPGQAGFAPAGRLTRFLELITSFEPS